MFLACCRRRLSVLTFFDLAHRKYQHLMKLFPGFDRQSAIYDLFGSSLITRSVSWYWYWRCCGFCSCFLCGKPSSSCRGMWYDLKKTKFIIVTKNCLRFLSPPQHRRPDEPRNRRCEPRAHVPGPGHYVYY